MATEDDPTPGDIMSMFTTLRNLTPERQRRLVIALLVLCGMYREAQALVDMALAERDKRFPEPESEEK